MINDRKKPYQRRTTRLRDYDYSQSGFYFVTICTHNKKCLFGKIVENEMRRSDAGRIAQSTWLTLPKRFPNVELDEYVIMPNHVHGIIICKATQTTSPHYHNLSAAPVDVKCSAVTAPPHHPLDAINRVPTDGAPPILGEIVRTFKAATTRHIRTSGMPNFKWQERFHDHIIRNAQALNLIRQYIINNPAKWAEDTLNIKEGTFV